MSSFLTFERSCLCLNLSLRYSSKCKFSDIEIAMSAVSQSGEEKEVKEVGVECFRSYSDNVWTDIGRESEGVAADTVQRCLALRPPHHHLTYYLRLAPNTSKGITKTDANTLVFVVLEGLVTVVMDFMNVVNVISKGDTFYVPMNSSFNILNSSQERAELYVFQYKYITRQKGSQ